MSVPEPAIPVDPEGETIVDHEVDIEQWAALLLLLLLARHEEFRATMIGIFGSTAVDGGGGMLLSPDQQAARTRSQRQIEQAARQRWRQLGLDMRRELAEFIEYEAEYQARRHGLGGAPAITPQQRESILDATAFNGKTLDEHVEARAGASAARHQQSVNEGAADGESADKLIRRVTSDGGEDEKDRRDLEELVRTATTHATNAVRVTIAEANPQVFNRMIHVSVLDSRTSTICVTRAGRVYRLPMKARDVPPLHRNCRSRVVPVKRGAAVPNVPSGEAWLRRQTKDRQDDILGPGIAKLWRAGKVPFRRLITPSLKPRTLGDLRGDL